MCWNGLDAAIEIEQATDIEYRGGRFYVTDRFRDCPLRRSYAPHIFLASLLRAEQAMAEYQAERDGAVTNVIPLQERIAG
jgi:hypothetical protein